MSSCTAHYYDIGHSLIHDPTYKARTLSLHTLTHTRPHVDMENTQSAMHDHCFPKHKQATGCLWPWLAISVA